MPDNLLQVMQDNTDNADNPNNAQAVGKGKVPKLPAGLTEADLKRMYAGMIQIRAYDERQKKLQRSGRIGFCVTSTGEEAVQVGTAHALGERDWAYPYYRQYGLLLYRGAPMEVLANHLYGNQRDLAKGRQMPAHYTHRGTHFVSGSSVIGTQLIHAVGTAMAAKYRKDPCAVVTYIGDGGTSSNDFHSCMTFAGVFKAPVVVFIVNNQYAISLPVSRQCAAETLALKGEGYGVPAVRVDGNDVVAVYQASHEAVERARNGEGPTLIELLTYRAGPHSSSDDPTRYRSAEEMDAWKDKDPIARFRGYLERLGFWSEDFEKRVWEEAQFKVNAATNEAERISEPAWETLFEDVYADIPPTLIAQRDELLEKESGFDRENEGEFPL